MSNPSMKNLSHELSNKEACSPPKIGYTSPNRARIVIDLTGPVALRFQQIHRENIHQYEVFHAGG